MAKNSNKKKPASKPAPVETQDLSKIGVKQVGSGISIYNPAYRMGTLEGPDRYNFNIYENAYRKEPIINRGIKFLVLTMLSSLGQYTHPDAKIQKFVLDNLDAAEGNLQGWLDDLITSALIYGRGNSEILWEARQGKIYLKGMANYHPRSIHLVANWNGQLTDGKKDVYHPFFKKTGCWQELPFEITTQNSMRKLGRDKWLNYLRIPLDKMCILAHNNSFGNFDGQSALSPIWQSYQMKAKTLADMMITAERYGAPLIATIVPNALTSNTIQDPVTGQTRLETVAESAARSLENMSVSTALVFEEPSGMPGEKIRVEPITTGNNFGSSFLDIIHKLNCEMLLGMGLPPLIFLEHHSGLGSGNVSAVQAEIYKETMVSMYKEFIEPFTEQVIGRLIKYNFGQDKTDPGGFEFNPYDVNAAAALAEVMDTAINCGVIDTSEAEDLQLCRSRLSFPAVKADSLDGRIKKNKELMAYRRNPDKTKVDGQMKIASQQIDNQSQVQDKQQEHQKNMNQIQLDHEKQMNQHQLDHQSKINKIKADAAAKVAKAKPKPSGPSNK